MKDRKTPKSQEGSAYWHYAMNSGYMSDGDAKETSEANPDLLDENDAIFQKPDELSEEDEERLAIYQELMSAEFLRKLPYRQRQVWRHKFGRSMDEKEIAAKLRISESAVRSHLTRAAKRLKAEIDRRRVAKERLNGRYFNNGFKKGVHVVGESKTDSDFAARLEKSEKEIDAFIRANGKDIEIYEED